MKTKGKNYRKEAIYSITNLHRKLDSFFSLTSLPNDMKEMEKFSHYISMLNEWLRFGKKEGEDKIYHVFVKNSFLSQLETVVLDHKKKELNEARLRVLSNMLAGIKKIIEHYKEKEKKEQKREVDGGTTEASTKTSETNASSEQVSSEKEGGSSSEGRVLGENPSQEMSKDIQAMEEETLVPTSGLEEEATIEKQPEVSKDKEMKDSLVKKKMKKSKKQKKEKEVQQEKDSKEKKATTKRKITSKKDKNVPLSGGVKKPHRFRPGTVALREIRKYQKGTDMLIPKAPFSRLVREIILSHRDYRITRGALFCLQQAAEDYLVKVLGNSYYLTFHGKRCTLMARDISLYRRLTEDSIIK